jgi:hypothetical protein
VRRVRRSRRITEILAAGEKEKSAPVLWNTEVRCEHPVPLGVPVPAHGGQDPVDEPHPVDSVRAGNILQDDEPCPETVG